jgi:hypothetical protein
LLSGSGVRVTVTVISGRVLAESACAESGCWAARLAAQHINAKQIPALINNPLEWEPHRYGGSDDEAYKCLCSTGSVLESSYRRAYISSSANDHANLSRTGLYGAASGPRPRARNSSRFPPTESCPEGFFSTSNLPTYVRVGDRWVLPRRPRMDCVIVKRGDDLEVIEPRRLKKGDAIAMGLAEDGSQGIYVHTEGFLGGSHSANEFRFMSTEVSRERPVNYEELAARLNEEKAQGGYLIWVAGPALVHSRARGDFEWFIRNGYVQAVLAGNAVAVHDIEAAIFGTTLGMTNTGQPTDGGHWPSHAGDQPGSGARLHREGGAGRIDQQRHHARARD